MNLFKSSQNKIETDEEDFPFNKVPDITNKYKKKESLFSFFKLNKDQNNQQQQQDKQESIFDKLSQSIQNKTQQIQDQYYSYTYFMLFLFLGIIFIFLSLFYIPLMIIFPQKFISFFTLGSLFIMISLALLTGPIKFLRSLFTRDKIGFSLSYIITLIGTIYFSIINQSYIFVSICGFSQIISLFWLISSVVPGGISVMTFLSNNFLKLVKNLLFKIIPSQKQSYLPF